MPRAGRSSNRRASFLLVETWHRSRPSLYVTGAPLAAPSLTQALTNMGEDRMTEEEADTVLKIADENGDGVLDYEEIVALVNKGDSGIESVRRASVPRAATTHPKAQKREHVTFNQNLAYM